MMKLCSSLTMSAQNETEVESMLMSPCWGQAHAGPTEQYLLDGHKLLLDHDLDSLPSSDNEGQKSTIEVLDSLLLNSHHQSLQTNLAELKPLPPFTGYTGHLSINGISGHHYHAISQRMPDDNNNNSNSVANNNLNHGQCLSHSPFSQGPGNGGNGGSYNQGNNCPSANQPPLTPNSNCSSSPTDHNIVSSSTCLPDSALHPDERCLHDVKLFSPDNSDNKLFNVADSCVMANGNGASHQGGGNGSNNNHNSSQINGSGSRNLGEGHRMADSVTGGLKIYSNESKELTEYDMSSIEDIAAIIGSAIADTTVTSRMDGDADTNHNTESRDSWMDLDAWIDGACVQADGKLIITQQEALGDYVMPQSPHSLNGGCPSSGSGSTLQSLLTHGYMPLLQNRLQNGPPCNGNSKAETPSSTSYGGSDLISTSTSPPSVVSTTDNLILGGGGNGLHGSRFLPGGVNGNQHHYQLNMNIKADGLCSPDLLNNNSSANNNNYPHTTSILGSSPANQQSNKMKRSRVPKHKMSSSSQSPGSNGNGNGGGGSAVSLGGGSHLSVSGGPLSPGASMSLNFGSGGDLSGLLGKEKPVHRCNICNRGFLNKSNIKVHLRTHTGEKPFRCDVCSKAFRQKAHLIKHQQIHKRIGRD